MQVIHVWGFEILYLLSDNYLEICGIYKHLGCGQNLSFWIKLPLNLKGFNNIQNKKTHVNKTIKERFTEWIILGEKNYTVAHCAVKFHHLV